MSLCGVNINLCIYADISTAIFCKLQQISHEQPLNLG